MELEKFYIGIDPGFKNLGIVALKKRIGYAAPGEGLVLPVYSGTFDLSEYSTMELPEACARVIDLAVASCHGKVAAVGIERYVAYEGVKTAEFENICMIIGMLRQRIHTIFQGSVDVSMYRAVEWKTALVQQMSSRLGYSNPSQVLDKKFSLSAAKFLSNNHEKISNTHTADAADIAALELLKRESFSTVTGSANEFSL